MTAALCRVQVRPALLPGLLARAAVWRELLARLGVRVPAFLVQDLGALWTTPPGERSVGPPPAEVATPPPSRGEAAQDLARYQVLVAALAGSEAVAQVAALRLSDEVVAALLARVLSELAARFAASVSAAPAAPRAAGDDPARAAAFLHLLVRPPQPLHLETAIELVDAAALTLLSLRARTDPGTEPGAASLGLLDGGGLDLLELHEALAAPDGRDIARFALELIPAVLETQQPGGAQTYPAGGYASIERRGSLDALLPGELAGDEDLFLARFLDGELSYYAFERQRPPEELERRLHCVLIDASPSMRGLRQIFARGLGLSLARKLSLLGGEVTLRFFDARLHEPIPVGGRRGPGHPGRPGRPDRPSLGPPAPGRDRLLPYVLGFRARRGRNYRRVFRELLDDVTEKVRRERRIVSLYLITHAECHVDVALVQPLTQLARVCGVFLLPSGKLQLDYLPLLHRHHVVSDAVLRGGAERRARALDIVADAARDAGATPERERAGASEGAGTVTNGSRRGPDPVPGSGRA